jgi:hypothetical protein
MRNINPRSAGQYVDLPCIIDVSIIHDKKVGWVEPFDFTQDKLHDTHQFSRLLGGYRCAPPTLQVHVYSS